MDKKRKDLDDLIYTDDWYASDKGFLKREYRQSCRLDCAGFIQR